MSSCQVATQEETQMLPPPSSKVYHLHFYFFWLRKWIPRIFARESGPQKQLGLSFRGRVRMRERGLRDQYLQTGQVLLEVPDHQGSQRDPTKEQGSRQRVVQMFPEQIPRDMYTDELNSGGGGTGLGNGPSAKSQGTHGGSVP